MACVYFDATTAAAGATLTAADGITSGDTAVLAESGNFVSTGGDAIKLGFVENHFAIYGSIFAGNFGILSDFGTGVFEQSVVIGEAGVVHSTDFGMNIGNQNLRNIADSYINKSNAGEYKIDIVGDGNRDSDIYPISTDSVPEGNFLL